MFNKNSLKMRGDLFASSCVDLINGFDSVVLISQRVDKFNVTVTYSDVRIWDDEINCRRVSPFLIKVHTLGRYPQLVKSERFGTFKDCLKWLVEEFRRKY